MSDTAHPKPKYGLVFVGLFVLTVIEVFAANLPIPIWAIVAILIGLALVKAALVAMFYMHLKWEKMLLIVIAFAPLIFSVIMVLVVGADLSSSLR